MNNDRICTCEPDEDGWVDCCTVHVGCDQRCMASNHPVTTDEVYAAFVHWARHSYLSGCSHAC